jgi:ankyrin repeat protein
MASRGTTPLHCAADIGSVDNIKKFMQPGAEISQNEWSSDNLLRLAISSNTIYEFRSILGSTVNLFNSFGSILLYYSFRFRASENYPLAWSPNIVRFLLQCSSTVYIKCWNNSCVDRKTMSS